MSAAICVGAVGFALLVSAAGLGATAVVVQGLKPRPKHRRTATVPAHLVPVGRWDQ